MTRSTNMEHVEVLERLRGVLEHGKMGDKCLIAPDLVTAAIAALSAQQSPAEAQPVAKLVNRKDADGGKTTTFIRPTSLGMDLPLGEYPLHLHPPPSAPVGVDAPGSRAWMAEVCRAAALSLAAHGVRNDQLSKVADWIAQQPAAVDRAYPTPRNRAEAVALARLALAHLGVIDAHIDAAIARCETDSAAQHQEPKS